MGGYGSGGYNCTHGSTVSCSRLDSFSVGSLVGDYTIQWGDKSSIRLYGYGGAVVLSFAIHQQHITQAIQKTTMANPYGGSRTFFLCPNCTRRVRYLYLRKDRFTCRSCAYVNYPSQQRTHDEFAPYWKAEKLLRERFKVNKDQIPCPFDLPYFVPPRPKGMHVITYTALSLRLEKLKDMYQKETLNHFRRLFG